MTARVESMLRVTPREIVGRSCFCVRVRNRCLCENVFHPFGPDLSSRICQALLCSSLPDRTVALASSWCARVRDLRPGARVAVNLTPWALALGSQISLEVPSHPSLSCVAEASRGQPVTAHWTDIHTTCARWLNCTSFGQVLANLLGGESALMIIRAKV